VLAASNSFGRNFNPPWDAAFTALIIFPTFDGSRAFGEVVSDFKRTSTAAAYTCGAGFEVANRRIIPTEIKLNAVIFRCAETANLPSAANLIAENLGRRCSYAEKIAVKANPKHTVSQVILFSGRPRYIELKTAYENESATDKTRKPRRALKLTCGGRNSFTPGRVVEFCCES
jgi:hypothetical protein